MADPGRCRRRTTDEPGRSRPSRRGHSIEIRINAEDPAGGKFLPSPGPITKLVAPDGFGVRFDSGYMSGDEISQYLRQPGRQARRVGRNREVAIARTIRALEELVVEGVATTIPADLAILRSTLTFAAMTHSTKWVEETLDLTGSRQPSGGTRARRRHRGSSVDVAHDSRGERQTLRRERCGSQKPRCCAGAPAAKKKRKRQLIGGGGTASCIGQCRGTDAGHDRQAAGRSRRQRRGRAGMSCSKR